MGCTSSSSADVPSKHPMNESNNTRQGLPSTSSPLHPGQETIPKVNIPKPERTMVLLYPFGVSEGTVLQKGDLLNLTGTSKGDRYWCEVSLSSNGTIHIPEVFLAAKGSISCFEWYYECLSKYEAEKKLALPGVEPGTFLVHQKSHSEDYICTTMSKEGYTRQYVIRSDKDGYFITRRRRFESVPVLIEAFMLNEGDDIPFMLSSPLPRVSPVVFSRYEGVVYPLQVEIDSFEIGEKVKNSELWDGEFNGNKVAIRIFDPSTIKQEEFTNSLLRVRHVYNRNLQLLIGFCCTEDKLITITEHFPRGNLKDYLKNEGDNLVESDLIKLCAQISKGMSVLELANITHGALSAHNVMIGNDDLLKVCDVGLKDIVSVKEKFVRWTAPEVLMDCHNTSPKSDVWSFGILLTEVVTLGDDPYPNLLDIEVETRVLEGYRMPMSTDCHAYLYVIMTECWNAISRKRPTFESIVYRLDDFYIAAEHETNPRQSLYRYIK